MGRNKFGPQRGPWQDHDWQGWWGDEPPFHTPVFVLTHHPRPSFTLSDTTFHFVDGDPADGARAGAGGRRGQGRPARRRRRPPSGEFLDADLVDTHARGGRAGRSSASRRAALGVARRAARPVPPRRRAQPERRDAPPVLAAVTRVTRRSQPAERVAEVGGEVGEQLDSEAGVRVEGLGDLLGGAEHVLGENQLPGALRDARISLAGVRSVPGGHPIGGTPFHHSWTARSGRERSTNDSALSRSMRDVARSLRPRSHHSTGASYQPQGQLRDG